MNVFNPAQFRAQFPALQDAGVYLDSAATALKPEAVVEATRQFYSLSAGNVHRSQFAEAQRLTARYEAAREKVAQLLNASDDKNIVWTRGTTESINMDGQIDFWVRNALDKEYASFYFESMGNGFMQKGRPVQAGIELRCRF